MRSSNINRTTTCPPLTPSPTSPAPPATPAPPHTAPTAPATTPRRVYFRAGQRAAAERVAKDLLADDVAALPGSGSLASAAPAGAEVVLVLGTASG